MQLIATTHSSVNCDVFRYIELKKIIERPRPENPWKLSKKKTTKKQYEVMLSKNATYNSSAFRIYCYCVYVRNSDLSSTFMHTKDIIFADYFDHVPIRRV